MKNFAPDNLAERAKGMGASDGGTAIGVNPYRSEYDLYLEKTGQVPAPDLSDNPSVLHGQVMEPVVLELIKSKLKTMKLKFCLKIKVMSKRLDCNL